MTLAPELPGRRRADRPAARTRHRRLVRAHRRDRRRRPTRPSTAARRPSRTSSTRCARSATATRASPARRSRARTCRPDHPRRRPPRRGDGAAGLALGRRPGRARHRRRRRRRHGRRRLPPRRLRGRGPRRRRARPRRRPRRQLADDDRGVRNLHALGVPLARRARGGHQRRPGPRDRPSHARPARRRRSRPTWSCSTTTSRSTASSSAARPVSLPEAAAVPEAPAPTSSRRSASSPRRSRALLEHERGLRPSRGRRARDRGATIVRMVGHGSSDNAASYGVYAFGLLPRWTALRDSITLTVHYDTRPRPRRLDRARALAVRPDAGRDRVRLTRARGRRASRVALTNDPTRSSPARPRRCCRSQPGPSRLGRRDQDLPEPGRRARALRRPRRRPRRGVRRRAPHGRPTCSRRRSRRSRRRRPHDRAAVRLVGRMFVIGRGTEFATAREIALKLLETCRVAAEPSDRDRTSRTGRSPRSTRSSRSGRSPRTTRPCPPSSRRRRACGRAGATLVASGDAAAALAGRRVRAPRAEAAVAAALAAALGRPRPALRLGARAGEGARPRPARLGLSKVTLAR